MKKACLALLLVLISLPASAQNVLLVSPSGGDFTDPAAALDAIGTTLPPATGNNRYMVKVNPGVYNVTRPVEMKPYVDLEGSGINNTIIRGTIGPISVEPPNFQGIINASSRSEIRDLTVKNYWSSSSAVGIAVKDITGSRITNVKSVSRGGAIDTVAWKYGIFIQNSKNVNLTHVIARGKTDEETLCQGLLARSSQVRISDSSLIGAGENCTIGLGLVADKGSTVQVNCTLLRGNGISVSAASSDSSEETTVRIRHSVLNGDVYEGTLGEAGTTTVMISHSELNGDVVGTPSCYSSHNSDLIGLNTVCMP